MMDTLVFQAVIRVACQVLPVLIAGTIKVSVLLALALVGAWLMRGTRPSLRRGMWLATMGAVLFVFILSFNGPLFHVVGSSDRGGGALTAVVSSVILPAAHPLDASSGMPGLAEQLWRRASSGGPWVDAWPLLVLFLWVAGVLSGWLNVLWGRLHLLILSRMSPRSAGKRYRSLMKDLSRQAGVRRSVRIVESPQCLTPLTLGVLRPAIVLPTSMQSWSSAGKRLVLSHELHHVRHGDTLFLGLSYLICSLFWFVPLVWVAYAKFYLEQEQACDAEVLDSGARPHAYASCILDTAQFGREPALPAGLSFAGRRRRTLKARILSILKGRRIAKHGALPLGFAALMLGAIAVLSASGLDVRAADQKKYGSFSLAEYPAKTGEEKAIVATLMQYESAFNSHDLQRLLSFFAKGAVYHPCGVSARLPIESKVCQDLIVYNFGFLKFERYFDPRVSVNGDQAVVNLRLETGDYLGDYTFVLSRQDRGWMVSETDYANVRSKG